jgi:hypothetical protein
MSIVKRIDRLPLGVLYNKDKPVFHKALSGDWNPIRDRMSRQERIKKVGSLLFH